MKTEMLGFLQWMLNYSILLSAQLAILILLRPFIRRWLGATASYCLWLLPLVWLPFYFVTWSAESMQQWLAGFTGNGVTGEFTDGLLVPAIADFQLTLPLPVLPELGFSQSAQPGVWIWLSAIWLVVVLALLVKEACKILRFANYVNFTALLVPADEVKTIRGNSELSADLPLVYLKGIESPALYGLLRPVLLLPEGFLTKFGADQRHIILSHEAVHHQRQDNFWNLAACLTRILFWFNPLVHIAYHCYRLDQELSCDALALTHCNENQARQYARTLLASVAQTRVITHPPIIAAWENPGQLKARIQLVSQHLQLADHKSLALFSLIVLSLAGGALTSCASSTDTPVATTAETSNGPLSRNSQTISRPVYNLVNEVVALRDMDDHAAAMAKLDEVKALFDAGRLNSREEFVMWQFYANLYQLQNDYAEAIQAYENLLAMPNLEPDQREQTLFYLGSLNFVTEDYREAIDRFEQYNREASEPNANVYFRMAAAYYQLEEYTDAIPYALGHIEILKQESKPVPKSSYDLLRAIYFTIGDLDAAIAVLEEALAVYNEDEDREMLDKVRSAAESGANTVQSPLATAQLSEVVARAPIINASDSEMLPTVTVQPDYPRRALAEDIEGWVLVGFTVGEAGEVLDPEVIDAEPENVFDDSALEAIAEFRFNPRIIDDRPIAVADVRYLFRYSQ